MVRVRQIAVLCPGSWEPYRQFVQGVTDYTAGRKDCALNISPDASQLTLPNLKGWPGDGVIAPLQTKAELHLAESLGIPVVNISGALRHSSLPRVTYDNAAIGRLAAEHLLESGLSRFAFYGLRGPWFSQERKRGFIARVRQAGAEVSVLDCTPGYSTLHPWEYWAQPLEEWLKTLKPPVGLMAVHDMRASLVVGACMRLGLRVPDDVAVLGVDNEEITCQFCPVPLSSVARNERLVGFEAAALLNRLMTKARTAQKEIFIPPDRVVKRRSTDLVAVDDQRLAAVVRYIREHIGEEFGVDYLIRVMGVSRSWLEHHCRKTFRCTPLEYLSRARVQRAKELLAGRDGLPIEQIARQCGFSGSRQFCTVFRRIAGATPSAYRQSHSQNPSVPSTVSVAAKM
jgi:LacI family transcriptional regulator